MKTGKLLTLILALSACTVLEDRSSCPCILNLDFAEVLSMGELVGDMGECRLHVECLGQEGKLTSDGFPLRLCPDTLQRSVPRGRLAVMGRLAPSGARIEAGVARISPGNQADSLYACLIEVSATDEENTVGVKLYKQFSTVYIKVEGSDARPASGDGTGDGNDIATGVGTGIGNWSGTGNGTGSGDGTAGRFRLVARGDVSGLDLGTLAPADGDFIHEIGRRPSDGSYVFRMPRQKGATLVADLYEAGGVSLLTTLPLGEYLQKAGYDFHKEDLEDIHISLGVSSGHISVRIEGWAEEFISSSI